MASLLLALIYIAFISLGLTDSMLGAAWPSMHIDLGIPISYAGIVATICSVGTMISSLLSERAIRKLGTGLVTAISVGLTAVALFGFAMSHSFFAVCFWSIPYGLGAGSVDAALNNFVALHYKSRHMSWLHCFWGVGATVGPYIMGQELMRGLSWNAGYQTIGWLQAVLVLVLMVSLPLWKSKHVPVVIADGTTKRFNMLDAIKLPGAKQTLAACFGYCSLEASTGFWASSYLVTQRGITPEAAAGMAAIYFLGITIGRFISGFVTMKLNNRQMVRLGLGITMVGILVLMIPISNTFVFAGLILIGLGCAPIYPSLLHQTPVNFGQERSQMLIGMQMATAYAGTTVMPLLFGLIAQYISMALYPFFLFVFVVLMVLMTEKASRVFDAQPARAAELPIPNDLY